MKSPKSMKRKVVSGLFWQISEKCGVQIVQALVQLTLARLLDPEAYGILGIITVFVTVCQCFVQSGLGNALIQKKQVDKYDLSSVFFVSIFLSVLVYVALFFLAPAIARFYQERNLMLYIRIQAIVLLIAPVNNIQTVILSRRMQFKKSFINNLCAILVYGGVGITLAYMGLGVWALICSNMANYAVSTAMLWFTVKWRPQKIFSISRVKTLFQYGWRLLFSDIIRTIYNNVYSLAIGKKFDKEILGYYNRGSQIPAALANSLDMPLASVLFPAMSACQEETERVRKLLKGAIFMTAFLIFPLMAGLAAAAKPFTLFILTEKWLPSVPYLQLCCISFVFIPLNTINLQAIKAVGRSDIFMKLEILKFIQGIIILGVSLHFGMRAIVIGSVLASFISFIINAYPNKKLIGYGVLEQMKDMLPFAALSLIMGIIVYFIQFLQLQSGVLLAVQIAAGIAVYFGFTKLFRLPELNYAIEIGKSYIKKK